MRRSGLLWAAVLGLGLAGAAGTARAAEFLSCVDGLPIPPALAEVEDSCLNFDTAAGRVVLAEARGAAVPDDVLRFYRSALPVFGWSLLDATTLEAERAGERLQISVEQAAGGGVRVRYALAPSPSP